MKGTNAHAALLALSIINFRVSIHTMASLVAWELEILAHSRQVRLRSVFRPLYKIAKYQHYDKTIRGRSGQRWCRVFLFPELEPSREPTFTSNPRAP